jgi:hypothetical protein
MILQEDIIHYQELLAAHRQTLRTYLYQRLMLGFMSPPGIRNGIVKTRAEIRTCKQYLRGAGIAVEDAPDDDSGLFDLAWLYHLIPIALLALISAGIGMLIHYQVIEPRMAAMPDDGWNIAVAGIAVEQAPGVVDQGDAGDKISDIVYGMLKPHTNSRSVV